MLDVPAGVSADNMAEFQRLMDDCAAGRMDSLPPLTVQHVQFTKPILRHQVYGHTAERQHMSDTVIDYLFRLVGAEAVLDRDVQVRNNTYAVISRRRRRLGEYMRYT
jgi:hypothetical protein